MDKKEKVILFGASKMGEAAYVLLKDNYDIVYFCDNDKNKWKKNFCGVEIISPESLKQDDLKNIEIIITSMYYKEIGKQLESIGIQDFKVFNFNFKSKEEVKYCDEKYKEFKYIIDNSYSNNKKCIKNLHLMNDNFYNKRFIEFVNENFPKDEHKFIIIKSIDYELKYIDNVYKYCNVEVLYLEYFETKLYYYVKNSERVFIHYLYDYICEFICKYGIEKSIDLNWMVWGGDLYEYINFQLYDEKTKEIVKYKYDKNIFLKDYYEKDNGKYRIEAMKRINNIMTVCEEEYNILKKNFEIKAKNQYFFYPNPIKYEDIKINLNRQYNLKSKFKYVILLGNSGDPSNNHLDILHQLKKFNDENFCIICPLSYGDENYISKIIDIGTELFGSKFIPLTDFLNSHEYYYILEQVDIVIMNQRRQQAVSSILALIYLGKKIYMKDFNPFGLFLNAINIVTFSIDLFNQSSWEEIFNYSSSMSNINKVNLMDHFNEKNCLKRWKYIFEY
ncbi:MAG: TDP-N-acetylfucosamine:lipid II N-acetylfucosaminyltransferase [Clostridiaceae bacterium]